MMKIIYCAQWQPNNLDKWKRHRYEITSVRKFGTKTASLQEQRKKTVVYQQITLMALKEICVFP